MGADPYQYVVDYQEDAGAALARLRQDVFERGDYFGADKHPRTPKEALAWSGDSGTSSILDIEHISQRPDYCCAAPLTPDELLRYFGTATPTAAMVDQSDALWEEMERGMARYFIAYEQGIPRHIVFVGYSFD